MVTTTDSPICNQLQLKTITARASARAVAVAREQLFAGSTDRVALAQLDMVSSPKLRGTVTGPCCFENMGSVEGLGNRCA